MSGCRHIGMRRAARSAIGALVLAAALALAGAAAAQDDVSRKEGVRPEAGASGGAGVLSASEATEIFREANALYKEERFVESAELYRAILEGGFENADVHYNLGNAHYRTGAIGRAVLEYERALRLDPRHEDARENLAFVREQLADRQSRAGGGTPAAALEGFYAAIPAGFAAAVTSAIYVLLVLVLILAVLRSGFGSVTRALAVVACVLLVAGAGVTFAKLRRERAVVEAVVVVPELSVRTGPGDDFVLEFKLHEGAKVRLVEERGDWSRVRVEGTDLEGWLLRSRVERIRELRGQQ